MFEADVRDLLRDAVSDRALEARLREAFRYAHRLDDVGRLESGACLAPYQVERVCNALADDGEPPGGEP